MVKMQRFVMVVCAALLFLPVIMKSRKNQDIPEVMAFRAFTSGKVSVKVSGDVLYPGIYDVPANSLADSVIKMAVPSGSLKQPVVCRAPHLLLDGSAVALAVHSDGSYKLTMDQMLVSERMILGIPLDISIMNESDFDRLPGIGPALAKRIIEYRQNNGGVLRVSDLTKIKGIGEKKYKKILSYF